MGFPVWLTRSLKISCSNIWSFLTSITNYTMHHHHQLKSNCYNFLLKFKFLHKLTVFFVCSFIVENTNCKSWIRDHPHTFSLHPHLWSSREVPSLMYISINKTKRTKRNGLFSYFFCIPLLNGDHYLGFIITKCFVFPHSIFVISVSWQCGKCPVHEDCDCY